ncbi:MAG: hypothetical protein EAS48_02195, partial [Chryseobacterium sp.]
KPISPRQALATASSFFSAKGELAKGNSNLQIVYTGTDESQARMKQSGAAAVPYYVINGKGTFVIVAGDDVALPILGYSDESEFDVRDIPINRQQRLAGYEEEMEAIYTYNIEQSETARNAWSTVASSQQTARRSGAPLIQTKWNQIRIITLIAREALLWAV